LSPLALLLLRLAATAAGVVIFVRALNVLRKMNVHERSEHYLAWLAFGLSYALLAVAAAGAVIAIWSGEFAFGHLIWLGASAGLILFDRRRRGQWTRDPEQAVPMRQMLMGLLILPALFLAPPADAAVIAVAQRDGVIVSLTDEPCRLEVVKNLPGRALWVEAGKVHEGCFAVPGGGILVAYFEDRTVVLFHLGSFAPASPA